LDRRSQLKFLTLIALLFISLSVSANPNLHADRIVIIKSKRTLTLYSGSKELKSYRVALGGAPVGPKTRQGDHRTPEGVYRIDAKNSKSQYHRALHVSYPNPQDRAQAAKLRVNPGGDIMIHGLPPAYAYLGPLHRQYDWTEGCIAVTNSEIEEIWKLVPVGTEVEIRP
jgi:murein L,D-transpeptidase YafK